MKQEKTTEDPQQIDPETLKVWERLYEFIDSKIHWDTGELDKEDFISRGIKQFILKLKE